MASACSAAGVATMRLAVAAGEVGLAPALDRPGAVTTPTTSGQW